MHTGSKLVRFPSYPFSLETLRPDMDLASLAAIIYESGHETQVLDYGTVETFERLFPVEVRTTLSHYAQQVEDDFLSDRLATSTGKRTRLFQFWRLRRMSSLMREHHAHICREISHEISQGARSDFVVFKVTCMDDLRSAEIIAYQLRVLLSDIKTVVWCPEIDAQNVIHGRVLNRVLKTFDCVFLGQADRDFVRICETMGSRNPWGLSRNVVFKEGGEIQRIANEKSIDLTPLPAPLYAAAVYPSLERSTKLKVFDIDSLHRVGPMNAVGTPGRLRGRSAAHIVEEVGRLVNDCDARSFHFVGDGGVSDPAEKVAYELLSKRLSIRYSRDVQLSLATPSTISALKASGCSAASFQIDTGSQRLLDRYYGHRFGVSHAEHILRACRFKSIFTVARLTYPSIEDDFHTKDETLRLVERARPDAAPVKLPPGHRWARKARHANAELVSEIEELGVFTQVSARDALMADLAGFAGREGEFNARIRQHLYLGDSIRLATVVEQINRVGGAASTASHGVAGPITPFPDVVGN